MKKQIFLVLSLMVALVAFAACSDKATPSDVNTDVENIPILIDRAILTDAVWGEGEEIPQDVSCVAGSQFVFDAVRNPFIISPNDGSDPHYTADVVATSSLNIQMLEGDADLRGSTCAEGDLYYLVSASSENPIDIEVADESCPDLTALAAEDGAAFPPNGTVTAHFESSEVTAVATTGGEKVTETGNSEQPEESSTQNGDDSSNDNAVDDNSFEYNEKLFKLVIDTCDVEDEMVDIVAK